MPKVVGVFAFQLPLRCLDNACVYFFKCKGTHNCRLPGSCAVDQDPLQCNSQNSNAEFTPLAEVPIQLAGPDFLARLRELPRKNTPLTDCNDNSKGFLCAECDVGYWKYGESCTKCPGLFDDTVGTCTDMCTYMLQGMCTDSHTDMCADMCTDMYTDMRTYA